jgi:glutamyl/glutaminyl-tRNA synthetase
MYDWAHGLEDSIEGITHSICTLEFENHRPLYDWFIDAINASGSSRSTIRSRSSSPGST